MTNRTHVAPRESASPAIAGPADKTVDVVVVGAGGGGLPAALFSRWLGNDVVLLEKAAETGGTARKAAFWYWVPNNEKMKAAGITDLKEDFLRYVSRISRPEQYDPDSPTLGMDAWSFEQFNAIYDNASPATELLKERGALPYRHVPDACDYWAELPENKAPRGRVLVHQNAKESMSDGGLQSVTTMTETAVRDGIDVRTSHRVQRVIRDGGRVVGVEALNDQGVTVRIHARKGVIFATGGFTHDAEMRKNFLSLPLYPGCGARTNEGDFIRISSSLGAQLRNMNYAWMCPIAFESSVKGLPELSGIFSMGGDSMIIVNSQGKRAVNEKLQYNELAQEFFRWDTRETNYPNRIMFALWDKRSQDHSAGTEYGNPVLPADADRANVIEAATLEELAALIGERLEKYTSATGGLKLAGNFIDNLKATILRYNGFAAAGVDDDFERGTRAVQLQFNGAVAENPRSTNPTMYPISETGPYYATLLTGGTLDTKGGPKAAASGQILDDQDQPIPGLFGVGNCVASASAGSYWAGGATLGPIIALAYRAANAIDQEIAVDREPATLTA